jgi:hypothetical protein
VILDLYCSESCFWVKAPVAFRPFGWLLAFAKTKVSLEAQPKSTFVDYSFSLSSAIATN